MKSSTLRRTAAVVAATALTLVATMPAQADPVKPPRLSAKAITSALNAFTERMIPLRSEFA